MFKNIFSTSNPVKPGYSQFDLSYDKKLTCDMGQLIPIMCDEVVPGDIFDISNEIQVRCMPLVAPILHEINVYVHYFFVPYRLLWPEPDGWESFISGGVDGDFSDPIPRWNPAGISLGLLWDYLGFPLVGPDADCLPLTFPRDAYNFIFNEFYRDETLQDPVDLDQENILIRNWSKDYFTSSLPEQQRGTAPSVPIGGIAPVTAPDTATGLIDGGDVTGSPTRLNIYDAALFKQWVIDSGFQADLSTASTFNVADLRLAFQMQRFMERNARCGVRYTEFIHAHFGNVAPRDERLQRPEYIGGTFAPIIISEVLQTSQTTTGGSGSPQGNMAGHGISVSKTFAGKYRAQEFGLIMGIMSIMPKPVYSQGFNRQWLRRSRYDFYFPEFAHLSEQAVERAELFINGDGSDHILFGFQGRYDEMRYKPSQVVNLMRPAVSGSLAHWHLSRYFTTTPELNESFIQCVPDKRIFAVPSQPGFLVNFGNIISALRPMPVTSEPGLIDHI